jgi:REP element-mobilizing transposase RayT
MRQTSFRFRSRGGRRGRSGRRPTGARARLRHVKRPRLQARFPVHVTWRMREGVWNLRTRRCFTALARAFWGGANRFGFRLVHYSVMGNHVHLLVEADDEKALSKGMNGLGTRMARRLNCVMRRRGKVLDDRYHGHILRTPTEVRRARAYLLGNAKKHYGQRGADPYTSTVALIAPDTFLMRRLC